MADTLEDPMILPRRVDAKAVTRTLKTAIELFIDVRLPSYQRLDGFDISFDDGMLTGTMTIRVPVRRVM